MSTIFLQRNSSYNVAAVGQRFNISESWDILSLNIQNPTGMWLYIPSIRQYIPPNTLGARVNINPPSKSIDIQFVNAPPNGVASVVTGGPITVYWFNQPFSDYQGLDYSSNAILSSLLSAINGLSNDVIDLTNAIESVQYPEINFLRFSSQASATPNTVVTDQLLPAPGGLSARWRLFGLHISFNSSIVASRFEFRLLGGGTSVTDTLGVAMINGQDTVQNPIMSFYPHGVAVWPANQSNYSTGGTDGTVQLQNRCNTASINFQGVLLFKSEFDPNV